MTNKFFTLCAILFLSPTFAHAHPTFTGEWNGVRPCLREKGIDFEGFLDLDASWNVAGGKKTSPQPAVEYLLALWATLKSDALLGYEGGTFFIEFESHAGKSPTNAYVGSYNFIDLIEAPNFNELYALWYKHSFDDKGFILVGKSDACDLFTHVERVSLFFNASYTFIPTILFFPTYPNPAMSLIGSWNPFSNLTLTGGIFDGSLANNFQTGHAGVFGHFFNHLSKHAFLIGEADLTWGEKFPGKLGIGAWHSTATFRTFDGDEKKGASGPYLIFDQALWQDTGVFFLFGSADEAVNIAKRYFALGFTWECMPDNTFGLAYTRTDFSKYAQLEKGYEAFYEVFYLWTLCDGLFLQPDYQYVVNPGGTFANASVLSLRLGIIF